jgi:hypothetical protein
MLYEWFSGLKHSVTTRIPHRMVLQTGLFFSEQSMIASFQAGQRAVTPVINYDWLHNWRYEYGVGLREPNRNWKFRAQGAIGDHLVPLSEGAEVDHSLEGSRPGVGELRRNSILWGAVTLSVVGVL